MINTHLKFEAKIPIGSKVVAFTRNYTKGRMIETSLTLDVVYIAQKCKLDLSWYDRSKSNFRKIPVLD